MCGLAPTMWISWKPDQNCDLYRDNNNYYKLKIQKCHFLIKLKNIHEILLLESIHIWKKI